MASKQRGRGEGQGRGAQESMPRIYEGVEVLGALLERAGAEVDGPGAISRLAAAVTEKKEPASVIPGFFPKEPRFSGPDEAMRLYGNLFGVWDLLWLGRDPKEVAAMTAAKPPPIAEEDEPEAAHEEGRIPLPPRGSVAGDQLPFEVVEGTWQRLVDLSERELESRQDRYTNLQPELAEWARTVEGLSPVGQETLEVICFELTEMFDHAFAHRLGQVRFGAVMAAEEGEAERLQPYAADYLVEALDEAEDEDEPIEQEDRAPLERNAKKAIVALTSAVTPP